MRTTTDIFERYPANNKKKKKRIFKKCRLKNCLQLHYAKGFCHKHYQQFHDTGSPNRIYFINKGKNCKAPGCFSLATIKGLCGKHYSSYKNHHSYEKLSPKGIRNVNWKGGISEYPNHYLMKKNRLIILINDPKCENCHKNLAVMVHHRNLNKSDHRLKNLMAVCYSCNGKLRHKISTSKYRRLYGMTLDEMMKKYGRSSAYYYKEHKENKLKDLLNMS